MSPDGEHRLELLITEGFATIRGELRLLARGEETLKADIGSLETEQDKLSERVSRLEERKFPAPMVANVIAVGAFLVSGYATMKGAG